MEDWTKNGLNKLICLPINGLDDRSIILGVIFTLSSLLDCSPGIKNYFFLRWHYIRFIVFPVKESSRELYRKI